MLAHAEKERLFHLENMVKQFQYSVKHRAGKTYITEYDIALLRDIQDILAKLSGEKK